MPNYYDIDTILAEEELLTVKPKFAFAYLSHLDPDTHHRNSMMSRKRPRADETNGDKGSSRSSSANHNNRLPEGTKIKMPLWAVDRWAMLNFVKIPVLPKHYRQKMKERLEADAVHMNLSAKSDHYFLAGILITNLLLRTVHVHKRNASSRSSSRAAADAEAVAMEQIAYDARSLQQSLLTAMMGDRLCRNFDWTLSALDAMEDDVSDWIGRLSVLERHMFERGVEASGAVKTWREYGCSRMGVSLAVVKGRSMGGGKRGSVTPSSSGSGVLGGGGEKQRVVTPNL